jgi:hypothetical protein
MELTEAFQVVQTTARNRLRELQDRTIRNWMLLARIQKEGKILYNTGGHEIWYPLKVALPEGRVWEKGGELNFATSDKHRNLKFDWRSLESTDLLLNEDIYGEQGPQGVIKRYAKVMPDLRTKMRRMLSRQLYGDGYTNSSYLLGFDSACGYTACDPADLIASPNDTYGELSTILGNDAGSWSADMTTKPCTNPTSGTAVDWPDGDGDEVYDYNSPLLLNAVGTGYTGNATFAANCEEVIRHGGAWMALKGGDEESPTLCMLANPWYLDYERAMATKFRTLTPINQDADFGFMKRGFQSEGMHVTTEFGVTAETGYLISPSQMEFRIRTPGLMKADGPEYRMERQGYIFAVLFFGQLMFNAKYLGKIADFTS